MPTLSFFYGVKIQMYWDEHPPAHFHVRMKAHSAAFTIHDLKLIHGSLPAKQLALVLEWARTHQADLLEAWRQCGNQEQPSKIEPLR